MSIEDPAKFADKHEDKTPDQALLEAIEGRAKNGQITCAGAFGLAKKLQADPAEVGRNIDLAKIRLQKCRLGMFGYDGGKNFDLEVEISDELRQALEATAIDNRLACRQAWDLAAQLGLSKRTVGSAAEKLGIKLKKCQLGGF